MQQLLATAIAASFLGIAVAGLSTLPVSQSAGPSTAPTSQAAEGGADAYGKLPLSFVPNRGQQDERVRFYAQSGGRSFYFMRDKVVLSFAGEKKGVALHLSPLGASANARVEAVDRAPGRVNYLFGSERHANIPTYRTVAYRDLWPGIDLVFRGSNGKLKYEFRLRPGADPSRIALAYRGADGLAVGAAGNLLIQTPLGTLKDSRPRTFQRSNGKRVPVASGYALRKGGAAYGFSVGSYDARRPLVIDPGLAYSTFLGGNGSESAGGIAVDGNGYAYMTGATSSADFPATPGAFDTVKGGGSNPYDVFVAKLNQTGSALVYATFIGGDTFGGEYGTAIAVDGSGSAYVTGEALTGAFPTTPGAYRTFWSGGSDAFVAKLSPGGSALVYSTFLGHSFDERGSDIAIDGAGSAYVVGQTSSPSFATTPGAADVTFSGYEGFVTKLNPSGSGLDYSTFLGGSGDDGAVSIDVRAGQAYVTGSTTSSDFPVTGGAYDSTLGGSSDAFVTKLNAAGSGYAYSTYLGGDAGPDYGQGVAVDDAGSAYVTGKGADFPTTPGAYDTSPNGGSDAVVAKLDPSGASLVYSTLLGGSGSEFGLSTGRRGIAVDASGSAWVTGETDSPNFPLTPGAVDTTPAGREAFLTKLDPSGSSLAYSTYLGGAGVEDSSDVADGDSSAYVVGGTNHGTFPTTAGAFDTVMDGSDDAFVAKLDDDLDGDGLPDEWETQGLTIGGDFVDLPAMGASPTHKDIFVETDYMQPMSGHTHKPTQEAINKILTAFDEAPVPNPDATTGIHLHVDNGSSSPLKWAPGDWLSLSRQNLLPEQTNLGTGGGTSASPYDWTAFDAIKNANFTAARRPIFHYNVWAHDLSPTLASTSGISRDRPASDFIVSLGSFPSIQGTISEQAGTFMHELGHNLGLQHGGGDGTQWKPNYLSVMNYVFQTSGLIVDGKEGTFDYSRQQLPQLNETSLDESNGIGTTMGTRYFCGLDTPKIVADGTRVNWNCMGGDNDSGFGANINQGTSLNNNSTLETLAGYNDWPNLVYNGGAVGANGSVTLPQTTTGEHELTSEENALLPHLQAPYARPASATPLRTPLVPAYRECVSPNSTHVAPLSYPACDPPVLDSTLLKLGTAGQGSAFAKFKVLLGNLSTPADESDVSISTSVTDVRKASDGTDYTGQLVLSFQMRRTDKANGPSTLDSATVQDMTFGIPVGCVSTPGPAGGSCSVATTADTLVPGFDPENKRAVISTPSVTVLDTGADGSISPPSGACPPACGSGDERVFLQEGVFTP